MKAFLSGSARFPGYRSQDILEWDVYGGQPGIPYGRYQMLEKTYFFQLCCNQMKPKNVRGTMISAAPTVSWIRAVRNPVEQSLSAHPVTESPFRLESTFL